MDHITAYRSLSDYWKAYMAGRNGWPAPTDIAYRPSVRGAGFDGIEDGTMNRLDAEIEQRRCSGS